MVTAYQARMREDTTKLKELAEYTSVITMGTVDAGKSTIFGHLAYLAKQQQATPEQQKQQAHELELLEK